MGPCRHRHAHGISHRIRVHDPVTVVDFDELQALSGYKQVSKVIDWLGNNRVKFVVGGDGKPRTTDDFLREAIDGETRPKEASPVLFGR